MNAVLKVFDLIPRWVYAAVIAALLAAVGVQQIRVANGATELAQEKQARSDEKAERAQMALNHTRSIAKLQADHAFNQQVKEQDYAAKQKKLAAARAADAVIVGELRDTIAVFAAGDRRPGEPDAVALQRARDRLEIVGGLLAEGVGLVTEGKGIIAGRDAEVVRLLDQIQIDRIACTPVPDTARD